MVFCTINNDKVNDDDDDDDIDTLDNVCALFDVCGGCVSGADDAESTSHTHSSPTQSAPAHQ